MPVVKTTRRVNRRERCPICGKADWCRIALNGSYAICNRVEGPKPARGGGGGWIHHLDGQPDRRREPMPRCRAAIGEQAASLERRDRVYSWLLYHGALSEQHKQQLLIRGFTPKEIEERHYISLAGGRAKLCRDVAEAGDSLAGVPGFYQKSGDYGYYWSIAGAGGLIIPCFDPQGRVRGLRVRPDEAGDGGKYRWLSSAERPGGAGSGVHCHVARPTGKLPFERTTVWITEGELKADFAAERIGAVVVSVPGVGSWALALADLRELLPDGGRVVVAFDSDWREKPPVHEALWNLAQACTALGFTVEVALWDLEAKGIDDLLAMGRRPTRTSLAELPAPDWTPKLSSRPLADAAPLPVPTIGLAEARTKLRRQPAPHRLCA